MKYRDPDSSSGGCNVTQLSACPVGTYAHVALRLRCTTHFPFNLVQRNALQVSTAATSRGPSWPTWLLEGRVDRKPFPASSRIRKHSFELEALSPCNPLCCSMKQTRLS